MNSGFLSICNNIDYKSCDDIDGVLHLSNYKYASDDNKYSCCVEGINQFSVRSSYIFLGADSGRVLPAQIESLKLNHELLQLYQIIKINAQIVCNGKLYRVIGSLTNLLGETVGEFVVKTSIITFLPTTEKSNEIVSQPLSTKIVDKNLAANCTEEHIFGDFKFLKNSFLAHEHFPSLPVFPASQSINVIYDFIFEKLHSNIISLCKFNFIKPIMSDKKYFVNIEKRAGENQYKAEIKDDSDICVRGILYVS